jgi:hypothetical protein
MWSRFREFASEVEGQASALGRWFVNSPPRSDKKSIVLTTTSTGAWCGWWKNERSSHLYHCAGSFSKSAGKHTSLYDRAITDLPSGTATVSLKPRQRHKHSLICWQLKFSRQFWFFDFGRSLAPVFSYPNRTGIINKHTVRTSKAHYWTWLAFEFITVQKSKVEIWQSGRMGSTSTQTRTRFSAAELPGPIIFGTYSQQMLVLQCTKYERDSMIRLWETRLPNVYRQNFPSAPRMLVAFP